MQLTTAGLGVVAQILAILILAAAFAPELRGTARRGNFGAWYRLAALLLAVVVVLADCLTLLSGSEYVTGGLQALLVGVNAFAIGVVCGEIAIATIRHFVKQKA